MVYGGDSSSIYGGYGESAVADGGDMANVFKDEFYLSRCDCDCD